VWRATIDVGGVVTASISERRAAPLRPLWPLPIATEVWPGVEFAAFTAVAGALVAASPRGDDHAVVVLPGFGGGDASTAPLRRFIARLGYRSQGWGLGPNHGFGRRVTDGLDDLLAAAAETGPVSLVGWSLGGVHAVELAGRRPELVRSIVTLGSPLAGRRLPAEVPMTSIFSRTDTIVGWRASALQQAPRRENVVVRASHLGLGSNAAVAIVVADRLSQRPDEWLPFSPPRWARRWLRS
jgi:pimeloyl-ACP methyl ester carboxylesterase